MVSSLQSLKTAAMLKSLKDQGLTNRDIIQLVKSDGREALADLAK